MQEEWEQTTYKNANAQRDDPEDSLPHGKNYVARSIPFRNKVNNALQCYLALASELDASTLVGTVDFMSVLVAPWAFHGGVT